MEIAHRSHTAGARTRYVVDYSDWLADDDRLATATVTVDSDTVTIENISVFLEKEVSFFVEGGVLNETFTVTVEITTLKTVTDEDTLTFFVVAP